MGKEVRKEVIYNGQPLTLTRFWVTGEPCLWIKSPEQRSIQKIEFVGGYPSEYCIFLKNLTAEELSSITLPDGSPINIEKEVEQL
ncbi:MAG: hypothetical protein K2J77_11780 [Oscillospiraceae bacterium]|nr:hypothetical protein [Oscillospiraceae bacterium]